MKISPMSLSVLFGVIPFLLLPEILEGNFLSRFYVKFGKIDCKKNKDLKSFRSEVAANLMRFVTLNCVFQRLANVLKNLLSLLRGSQIYDI